MLWLFAYRILIVILLPIILIRLWLKGSKELLYRQRITERFGILSIKNTSDKKLIWLHCVSVGEFLAAKPLIDKILLKAKYQLLITCTTATGSQQILCTYPNQVLHSYMPFDIGLFYQNIITKLKPKICVIIETEIWANLIISLKKHNIPSILINARLSNKSFKKYQKIAWFSSFVMQKISYIATQNQQSYDYFSALGVDKNNLSNVGNIKFDFNLEPNNTQIKQLKPLLNKRKILLFASTHSGEEKLILEQFSQQKTKFDNALMVLVPRHPNRCNQVAKEIYDCGLSSYKRSENKICTLDIDVLLVDTLGELLSFYALADLCFIGGSLVDRGGHNMLEPAGLKKPILFGQYVHNFPEISQELLTCKGAIQVLDAQNLFKQLDYLNKNPKSAGQLSKNSYTYFKQNQGTTNILLQLLETFV